MHGRDARASWVKDEREAGGAKVEPFAGQRPGHLRPERPLHVGEPHPRLLEQGSAGEEPRAATAAARSRPGILAKMATAVGGLDRGRDALLKPEEEIVRAVGNRRQNGHQLLSS